MGIGALATVGALGIVIELLPTLLLGGGAYVVMKAFGGDKNEVD